MYENIRVPPLGGLAQSPHYSALTKKKYVCLHLELVNRAL